MSLKVSGGEYASGGHQLYSGSTIGSAEIFQGLQILCTVPAVSTRRAGTAPCTGGEYAQRGL